MELNYPPEKIKKIVNFYLKIKKNFKLNILDGNGKRPHYRYFSVSFMILLIILESVSSFILVYETYAVL